MRGAVGVFDKDRQCLPGVAVTSRALPGRRGGHLQADQVGPVFACGIGDNDGGALATCVDGSNQLLAAMLLDLTGQFEGFSPTSKEIQVHLVRLRPGDPVVVGAENQLTPGFVEGSVRDGGAQQAWASAAIVSASASLLSAIAAPVWCR